MPAERHPEPKCPRCGYSQRGVVATWEDHCACPMEGTCAECGLEYLCRDVMRPGFTQPEWCVEYAPGRPWPFAKSIVGTFARSWLPWVFWRRLKLHHEVRLRRLLAYAILVVVLPAAVFYLSAQITVATLMHLRLQSVLDVPNLERFVTAIERRIEVWENARLLENADEDEVDMGVFCAEYAGLIPQLADEPMAPRTQEEWEPMWHACMSSWENHLEELNFQIKQDPPRLHMPYILAVAEAVLLPLRESSWGYFVVQGERGEYPAPADLWDGLLGWGFVTEFEEPIGISTFWALIAIAYPLTFAALPITRRRAKVRAVHFVRIFFYSLAFPATFAALTFGYALVTFVFEIYTWHDAVFFLSAFLVQLPLILAYWYFAVRTHLRLPRPAFVTIVLGVVALLAVAASVWIVHLLVEALTG